MAFAALGGCFRHPSCVGVVYRVLLLASVRELCSILSGIGILSIAYFVSIWLELITFHWILETFFTNLFLIVVILFQTEIRQALAQLGSNPLLTGVTPLKEAHLIEEIAKAASTLAQKGFGGLNCDRKRNQLGLLYRIRSSCRCRGSG